MAFQTPQASARQFSIDSIRFFENVFLCSVLSMMSETIQFERKCCVVNGILWNKSPISKWAASTAKRLREENYVLFSRFNNFHDELRCFCLSIFMDCECSLCVFRIVSIFSVCQLLLIAVICIMAYCYTIKMPPEYSIETKMFNDSKILLYLKLHRKSK